MKIINHRLVVILTAMVLSLGFVDAPTASEHEAVTIEYIAHACFRITAPSGERLLIDPFASRVWIGYDYPAGIDTDAVLITHPHYDHDGGISVDHPAPWPDTMTVLREPGSYAFDGIEIHGVAGKHADPYGEEFGQTNTIWLLEVAGLRIAHLGDNGPLSQEAATQLGHVDILMMPIDAKYHILKEHQIQTILDQLTPKVVIPMHYRLADLERTADGPEGLGGIDDWLMSRRDVRRLTAHRTTISLDDLPGSREIFVFEHSPTLEHPRRVQQQ